MKKINLRISPISLTILLVFSLFTPYTFGNKSFAETNKEWIELEVENGDFDNTPTSETDLPSWDLWTGGLKEGMTITDEFAFEGKQSLKIDNPGVIGVYSQAIDVTEGTEYRLSAQLYVEELASGAHGPGIWLRWYNDEGVNGLTKMENILGKTPMFFKTFLLNSGMN